MAKNLYQILGITEHASREEVNSAYQALRAKANEEHEQGNASARDELFALDGAYETLYEPERRAAYDAKLKASRKPRSTRANSVVAPLNIDEALKKIAVGGIAFLFLLAVFKALTEKSPPPSTEAHVNTDYAYLHEVSNSPWDGSVRQVEQYLKNNLKDPDSYQSIAWDKVSKMPNGTYVVRHKFRAKNSFGGFSVEDKLFFLDANGNVVGTSP